MDLQLGRLAVDPNTSDTNLVARVSLIATVL